MKVGDILICKKDVTNYLGWPLFEKDKRYQVLDINETDVILDHNLYGSEFGTFPLDWVKENFSNIIDIRNSKIKSIINKNEDRDI